jgi:4'-phosphopantetheinyl transferase
VPLATTPAGRPFVPGGRGLDVSCSASGSLGLVAVSRAGRVGIDVQRVAPWSPAVLHEGWLGPGEQAALLALPVEDRSAAVTRAWTQKEAVLKGRGTGLPGGLAATETPIGRATGRSAAWELSDVPVPDGWVASLALAADDRPQEIPS